MCEQIQTEQDHTKFAAVLLELSILLESKSDRLKDKKPPPSNPISNSNLQNFPECSSFCREVQSELRVSPSARLHKSPVPGARCAGDFSRLKYADVQTNP
jgi:hypothetical protein